jgi:hypothetical protein
MFFAGSRYEKTGTYQARRADGVAVVVARLPLPPRPEDVALRGSHPRQEGQRLDHVANHYLADPAGFWRLCDANDAVVPDALGARPLIAIPRKGR